MWGNQGGERRMSVPVEHYDYSYMDGIMVINDTILQIVPIANTLHILHFCIEDNSFNVPLLTNGVDGVTQTSRRSGADEDRDESGPTVAMMSWGEDTESSLWWLLYFSESDELWVTLRMYRGECNLVNTMVGNTKHTMHTHVAPDNDNTTAIIINNPHHPQFISGPHMMCLPILGYTYEMMVTPANTTNAMNVCRHME